MDFKFNIKLDGKQHKAAVHYPTAAALTLALKNIFYRHYKTDDISIPYIGREQVDELMTAGQLDLVGVTVKGELLDSVRVTKGAARG